MELDIDALFGTEQAMKYREKLESEIGYQCMPIWHKERGMQSFKQDVEKYDYVGIGGLAIKTIKRSDWEKLKMLTSYARKRHTKLHAMGFTPSHDVYKYGFYSSDSSSWTSSMRFGTVYRFDGRGISSLKNVKYKRVKGDDYNRAFCAGYLEWLKYQAYVDIGRNKLFKYLRDNHYPIILYEIFTSTLSTFSCFLTLLTNQFVNGNMIIS